MEPVATDGISAAKRRLVELLKRSDSRTVAELADHLDLTPMAVRQHLQELERSGLVARTTESPDGPGRPRQRWSLTELADGLFPDRHADLTVSLIAGIRQTLGADALDRVIEARTSEQLAGYRSILPTTAPLAERVHALVARRTDEGYEAEVATDGDAWLLIENHCPVCDAARACLGLCSSELLLFQEALGPDSEVERVQHLLSGDRRCVYRITPRSTAAGRPDGA